MLSKNPQRTEALFEIKVKLHEDLCLVENVYKEDTPITIFDRIFSKHQDLLGSLPKEARKMLQTFIEFEVNQSIKTFENAAKKHQQTAEQR